MVTRPAPERSAASAARREAPVLSGPPDTTSAWPRPYLCPCAAARGSCGAAFSRCFGSISARTSGGRPMSATTSSPQRSRPGISRWPGFLRKKVTVTSARIAAPRAAPVVPSRPEGTSMDTTGTPAVDTARTISSGTGRDRPAPNSASTISPAPVTSTPCSTAPVQRAAIVAASPLSASRGPSSARRTGHPQRLRYRATTKPSPPLLPGPHSTSTGLAPKRRTISSATARPARSISSSDGTPAATASASARYISSVVRSSGPMPDTSAHTPCSESHPVPL